MPLICESMIFLRLPPSLLGLKTCIGVLFCSTEIEDFDDYSFFLGVRAVLVVSERSTLGRDLLLAILCLRLLTYLSTT